MGAFYLLYLGGRLILFPRRQGMAIQGEGVPSGTRAWARGFLTNILNPKVGIFYISFLPQFIPAQTDVPVMVILLACIHVTLGLAWFGLLIAAARSLLPLLQSPRVVTAMDRLTGLVFLGFGLKLAFSDRP